MRAPLPENSSKWRENWIANIRMQARQQVPAWLQELRTERLAEKPRIAVTTAAPNPATPRPAVAGDTGPISMRTEILPIVRLLEPVDVRDTRELVSSAVKWFHGKHGCLPTAVRLNPLRCLTIVNQRFFPLDDACADLGCYTMEVLADSHLPCDVVWFQREDIIGIPWGTGEDSYL